jgi:acetoin utilization protein AcuB
MMSNVPVVEQVMTREPSIVSPGDAIRAAVESMQKIKCRRLPVVEKGHLVGVVSSADLRRATNSPMVMRERWQDEFLLDHVTVGACMTPNPISVTPSTPIVEAARLMMDRKIGGLLVVDGERLVGIVTETDLLNYLIRTLEHLE